GSCPRGCLYAASGPAPSGVPRPGSGCPSAPCGSLRAARHPRGGSSGPACEAASPRSPPRAAFGRRRRWISPPARRRRSGSAGNVCPSRGSQGIGLPELPQVVHVPPFFQEHLGELQLHHRLPELRPCPRDLAFQRIAATLLQPGLGPAQESLAPFLDHRRRHLDLPAQLSEVLAPEQSRPDLALASGTPSLRAIHLAFLQHLASASLGPFSLSQSGVQRNRVPYTYMIQFNGLLRPLIHRQWAGMVARLNRMEEARLE